MENHNDQIDELQKLVNKVRRNMGKLEELTNTQEALHGWTIDAEAEALQNDINATNEQIESIKNKLYSSMGNELQSKILRLEKQYKQNASKLRSSNIDEMYKQNSTNTDKYAEKAACELTGDLAEPIKMGKDIDFTNSCEMPTTFIKRNIVEHPSHYGAGKFQCLEAMLQTFGKQATLDFCRLNAFKYLWRSDHKGTTTQDMEKAGRYIEYWKVLNALEGEKDDGSFHDYLNA